MSWGTLSIVGTGIKLAVHMTPEARSAIERAQEVYYLVPDHAMGDWLQKLNPTARSLEHIYTSGIPRTEIYAKIVQEVTNRVREGLNVCLAFYGHPTVFVQPANDLIKEGAKLGFKVRVVPGISADACLFADLGVDPGLTGCLSYESSDFLLNDRPVDITAALVLWQIGAIGARQAISETNYGGMALLVERLLKYYPAEHEVTLYEARTLPMFEPIILKVPLEKLLTTQIPPLSTMYIGPVSSPKMNPDMVERFGALAS